MNKRRRRRYKYEAEYDEFYDTYYVAQRDYRTSFWWGFGTVASYRNDPNRETLMCWANLNPDWPKNEFAELPKCWEVLMWTRQAIT